jgi:energy-coupling factor transporter ATP-binding protein EcfA2
VNNLDDSLLELRDWSLSRETPAGRIPLLRDVNLKVRRGEWIGILGANGSGKSSLLRWLAGDESPLAVRVGMVFQDPDEGFVGTTVTEELVLGRPEFTSGGRVVADKVAPILSAFGLTPFAQLAPQLLSAGQKQRLALAVVLSGAPDVLLCDEPTSLQDAEHAAWIVNRIRRWQREGDSTVLYATLRRHEAELADRLLLFRDGRILADGPPADVLTTPEAERVLDRDTVSPRSGPVARDPEASREPVSSPVAEWRGVGCRFPATGFEFRSVDLVLPPGQRIGLTGPSGCGKSTLLAVAAGLRPPDVGQCLLRGRILCADGRADLDHGAALLAPQFPEYFFTRPSVRQEIELDPTLANLGCKDLLAAAGLASSLSNRNPHELSSGQKRRLAVAMVVFSGRPLLLLDEPTACLDREGRTRIVDMLARLPAETTVVVASHDTSLLAECGCEIYNLSSNGLQRWQADS